MKLKSRRLLVWLVVAAVAVTVWVLVPSAFVHGVIVGFFVTPAIFIGGLALFAMRTRKRSGGLKPPPLPVASWDYEMKVEDLDGDSLDFSHFSGKVLVLNFWATWCRPCIAEMPSLQRLQKATSDLDIELACVTTEEPATVRKFLAKNDLGVPVYTLSAEPPECFVSQGIPSTFVIDKAGTIALRHVGAASWDDQSVVTFVRGLAAAPTN